MIYLFTTNQTVANFAASKLDNLCGYPNPDTLTDRAVPVIQHPTKSWWIVPIPDGVYGPKLKVYMDAHGQIPSDRINDPILDTVADAQN